MTSALTVLQPWASLIALDEKQFETRSWSTPYRGTLVIHAGKSDLPFEQHYVTQETKLDDLPLFGGNT